MMRLGTWLVLCLTLTIQPGHVKRIHDGDTFFLYHVGATDEEGVRLLGVDTWELNEDRGPEAKAFTVEWIAKGPFRLMACRREKYGRLLATVSREGVNIADELKARGLGR